MRQGHRLSRSQPIRGQDPRDDEARALLDTLTARLPSAVLRPGLRVVQGSPGDTHLHHHLGRLPEVRVTDQLLDRAPTRVVSGVLAHELAHLMNRDSRRRRRYGLALTASAGTLLSVTLTLPGARFWLSPVTYALGLVLLALSRQLELQADSTSLRLVDVNQAAAALTWLQHDAYAADGRAEPRWKAPSRLVRCDLLSTHPNPDRRLRELRRAAQDT